MIMVVCLGIRIMKKYIGFILLIVASMAVIFIHHSYLSRKVFLLEQLVLLNEHSAYQQFSDISSSIKDGNIKLAKCSADLMASSFYRHLSVCEKGNECSEFVKKEMRQNSPEFNDPSKIKFKFYKSGELCYR